MPRLTRKLWQAWLPGAVAMVAALGFTGLVATSSEPAFGDAHGPVGQDPKFIELRIEWADFCAVEAGCALPGISDIFTTYRIPRYMQTATLEYLHQRDECPDAAKRYAFGRTIRIAARPAPGGDQQPACPLPNQ